MATFAGKTVIVIGDGIEIRCVVPLSANCPPSPFRQMHTDHLDQFADLVHV